MHHVAPRYMGLYMHALHGMRAHGSAWDSGADPSALQVRVGTSAHVASVYVIMTVYQVLGTQKRPPCIFMTIFMTTQSRPPCTLDKQTAFESISRAATFAAVVRRVDKISWQLSGTSGQRASSRQRDCNGIAMCAVVGAAVAGAKMCAELLLEASYRVISGGLFSDYSYIIIHHAYA